jgi:hypothetical protein
MAMGRAYSVITVDIRGLQEVQRALRESQKQARFALALALTRTAQTGSKRLQSEMQQTLDNPTPWVAKGTFNTRADKTTLTSRFGVKDRQSLYVKEHFEAGVRGQKPYEKVLRGMGALPDGYRTVPGSGLKLDTRGNPNRNQLREMIGSIKSRVAIAQGRCMRMKLVGYFAVLPGSRSHLSPGIYLRSAKGIRPMLIFVQEARYRKVLDIVKLAEKLVAQEFPREFSKAFDTAMKTAR